MTISWFDKNCKDKKLNVLIRAKMEEYNGERRSKYSLRKAEKCIAKV